MMCSDHGTVDHVRLSVLAGQLGQRVQHDVEDAALDPSSVAAEHAVPLAVVVR